MADYRLTHNDAVIRTIDDNPIPSDPANRDRAIYDAWLAKGNVPDPYVEPSPPVPEIISDRQFFQQLAAANVISEDEAIAAVATGTIPPALLTVLNSLPGNQKFAAKMKLSGAVEFHRHNQLTIMLGHALKWTDEQIDGLWQAASQL